MNLRHWISAFVLLSPLLLKTMDAADHKKQSSSVIDAADHKKQSSSVIDAADHKKQASSSVTVVGRVFCDTCFQRKFTTKSFFIPGAWVAVECKTDKKNGAALGGKDKTDRHGIFRIQLPLDFSSEKDIQSCGVRLLRTSVVSCNVPFIKKRSRLVIKSKMNNNYMYNVPPLTFRPARLPVLCKKQPPQRDIDDSKLSFPPISFPFPFPFPPIPPIGFPFPPFFPPIGDLPPIPFWPPLPDIPPPPPPNVIQGSPPPLPFSPPPTPNPMGSSPPLFPPPPPLPIVRYIHPPPIPLPSSPLRA